MKIHLISFLSNDDILGKPVHNGSLKGASVSGCPEFMQETNEVLHLNRPPATVSDDKRDEEQEENSTNAESQVLDCEVEDVGEVVDVPEITKETETAAQEPVRLVGDNKAETPEPGPLDTEPKVTVSSVGVDDSGVENLPEKDEDDEGTTDDVALTLTSVSPEDLKERFVFGMA